MKRHERNLLQVVAYSLLAMSLTACGGDDNGGGGGGSSSVSQDRIEVIKERFDDSLPIPLVNAEARTTLGTSAEEAIENTFPIGNAESNEQVIIRSEDGTDYTYIFRQPRVTNSMPDTLLRPATNHQWEFVTDAANDEVAMIVGGLRGLADIAAGEDNNIIDDLKGGRVLEASYVGSDGNDANAPVDMYIFETDFSALGLWFANPSEFLLTDNWDPGLPSLPGGMNSGVLYFGLQTPADIVLARQDSVTYDGLAGGYFLREGGKTAANRFLVGGTVELTADFASSDSPGTIFGTAVLGAFPASFTAPPDGAPPEPLGEVIIGLDMTPLAAAFSGTTSIGIAATGPSNPFTALGDSGDKGEFNGMFTGIAAEEVVGTADAREGSNVLEFGFIARDPTQ